MFILRKISFHVTERCNLQCYGCDNHSNLGILDKYTEKTRTDNLLDFLTYISDLPYKLKIQNFHLIGGEPFLNKNLSSYLEILNNYTHIIDKVILYTNGTIINKSILESIKQYKNIFHIHISVHSVAVSKINEKINKFVKYLKVNNFSYELHNNINNDEWVLQWLYKDNKIYPANQDNNKETWLHCTKKDCKILDNDKIYYCSPIAFIEDGLQATKQITEDIWKPYLNVGYFEYKKLNPYDFARKLFEHKEQPFCNMCLTHTPKYNNYPIFKKDYPK